jgi:hypothetical protein
MGPVGWAERVNPPAVNRAPPAGFTHTPVAAAGEGVGEGAADGVAGTGDRLSVGIGPVEVPVGVVVGRGVVA